MFLYNKKKDKYFMCANHLSHDTNKFENKCHQKKKDKQDKLVEFAGEIFMPINPNPATNQILIPTTPRVVSSVSLDDVKEGNVVWLNGLFQVNNNDATPVLY